MNKRILSAIAAVCLLGRPAFAAAPFGGQELDRAFDKARTLYYIQITQDQIPDIEEEGYTLVKKATAPYSGGALTEENTTVLKDNESGVRYRFVFEKKGTALLVDSVDLSGTGVLMIKGNVDGAENVKTFLLKPKGEFSEETYAPGDIDFENMEETVLDMAVRNAADCADGTLVQYTFATGALSGQYGILITAGKESYYTSKFYMAEKDIKKVIETVNEKSVFDETNTVQELRAYVEKNTKALYLDTEYYNKLSDAAKTIAVSYMESNGDYETLAQIGGAFYKGVAAAGLYDGLDVQTILDKYNNYLKLELYEQYKGLRNKSAAADAVRGVKGEDELRSAFSGAVALCMINEAEPGDIEKIMTDCKDYLKLSEAAYAYFEANTAKCVKALANKNFKSASEIDTLLLKMKNGGGSGSGNGGGGVSGSKPSSETGYVAPIADTKQPTNETKDPEQNAADLPFDDIGSVTWAQVAIEHLYNNKILNGKSETKFAPNDNVKREEFAKMIVNAFSLDKAQQTAFADVDADSWYAEFLNVAFANGIINGINENEFGVGKPITREDIAVMICRAVKATGMNTDIIVENPAELSDLAEVSDYAKEAVEFMIEKGAVKGADGKFSPKAYATRAQTAQMLYQIIKIR